MAFKETTSEAAKSSGGSKLEVNPNKRLSPGVRETKPETSDASDSEAVNPNKRIEPAQQEHRDDNGEVYRVGDNLLPNKSYEVNGYEYHTDSHGRIKSAEGQLRLDDSPRKSIDTTTEKIGKGDQRDGDERGHLMGDRFGGSNDIENMALMTKQVNRTDFKKIENNCAKALKGGGEAYMKITPKYEGGSNRATSFRVVYTINGERHAETLKNEGSAK